jgi:hypothetical protein
MPSPVWKFDIPRDTSGYVSTHINAMVEEVDAPALIFASGSQINRMDLASGATRELIRLPGNPIVHQMAISVDGAHVGVASQDFPQSGRARSRNTAKHYWEVWSLPSLRGAFIRSEN